MDRNLSKEDTMPVATPEQYRAMLDAAKAGNYAYPAMNVTSLVTINAALKGFADKKSDGIIQVSTGGGKFASGLGVADAVDGAIMLAEIIHLAAEKYDILVGIHTDHCQPGIADEFLLPLIEATQKRREEGRGNLFQYHMLDASELPLDENLNLSERFHKLCTEQEIILEVEAGVVGGEEDGVDNSDLPDDKLYTSPEDMLAVYERLISIGRFMFAATFGNVHGHYKPGAVKLRPDILTKGQAMVMDKHGAEAKMDLVFHGGSGTPQDELRQTLNDGVIKMNIDTDTQYAFTNPIAKHMFENVNGVLKIDGEIGNKKMYDPRSYLRLAEASVSERIGQACDDLQSSGKTIYNK